MENHGVFFFFAGINFSLKECNAIGAMIHRFFLFLLFFPLSLSAEEISSWNRNGDGTFSYVVLHSESGKYYVEEFFQKKGDFQDRTKSFSYSTFKKAKGKFDELSKGFHRGIPKHPPGPKVDIDSPIWLAKEEWSWEWEKKYENWIRNSVTADFFLQNQIATDCADAAFALRWIFARINLLPAGQTLAGSGILFTNESMRSLWQDLPTHEDWHKDQRFRAALDYLLKNTYTHSLMKDLYPIAISKQALIPGTVILNLYDLETGHTEIVAEISSEENAPEPIKILASDAPREIRRLNEYPLQDWGGFPVAEHSGFFHFRWPVKTAAGWVLTPDELMPEYSMEQFHPSFSEEKPTLTEAVIYRLFPNWQPNYAAFLRSQVEQALQRLRARIKIVEEGFAFCSANPCEEGTPGWESWSTPSRDKAIARLVNRINRTYQDPLCNRTCRQELLDRLATPITQIEGKTIDLRYALKIWDIGRYSYDPRDSIPKRWGL
jgi:hypothetical protein